METVFERCAFQKPKIQRAVKTTETTKISTASERDLKRIEKQLNEYLKGKKGRGAERFMLNNFNESTTYDEKKFDDFITREIQTKFTNKKWGSLPLSYRWNLLQDFAKDQKYSSDDTKKLKAQLQKNTIQVKYDAVNCKILSVETI